jgi:hypothetical protein
MVLETGWTDTPLPPFNRLSAAEPDEKFLRLNFLKKGAHSGILFDG